jgi:hypothetical protein
MVAGGGGTKFVGGLFMARSGEVNLFFEPLLSILLAIAL